MEGRRGQRSRPVFPGVSNFRDHTILWFCAVGSLPGTSTSRISFSHLLFRRPPLTGPPALLQQMREAFASWF